MIILLILIYLTGVVLAYGKVYGSLYFIDKRYSPILAPAEKSNMRFSLFIGLFSWIGFASVCLVYLFTDDENGFLIKFSCKDLRVKHENFKRLPLEDRMKIYDSLK